MPSISFYRQHREDGGTRTGIDFEGDAVFHHFEPGPEDSDPALLWFVELRCEGSALPRNGEKARQWLLDKAPTIRQGFATMAEELAPGIDPSPWPVEHNIASTGKGVRMKIVCCAVRRLAGRQMATVLKELAAHWEEYLHALAPAPWLQPQ